MFPLAGLMFPGAILRLARLPRSAVRQGLKPLFFKSLDVAAEAATHKDN